MSDKNPKKSPLKAFWLKKNLKKEVKQDPPKRDVPPPSQAMIGMVGEFGRIMQAAPYKDMPKPMQDRLAKPVHDAIDAGDEQGTKDALATFKLAVQKVADDQVLWTQAATRVTDADTGIGHLERWAAGAAPALRQRHTGAGQKATGFDFAGALADLTRLDTDVPAAQKSHYEQQRGLLTKDETAARNIGDVPPYLTGLRTAYENSERTTTAAAGLPDFVTAVDSLPQLQADLKTALTGLKRSKTEKGATDNRTDIQNGLDKVIKVNGIDTKVRDAVGTKEWKEVVKKIVDTKLDDEFMERYNAACDQVADAIKNSAVIKDAKKNWKTWTKDFPANKDKIEAAMQEMLNIQSATLGWPTPVATPYDANDGDLGSYSGNPYPPGKLKVNFHYSASRDFKELIDTVTHENTHAYQEKLIRDLRAGTLNPGDENYAAAVTLEMNDTGGTKGYINGDKSAQYKTLPWQQDEAYKKQPCEAHAWSAGGRISRQAWKSLKNEK